MKNNIYLIGIICLAITLVAVLFKVSHLAGANWLLLAGLGSISLIFMPMAFLKLRKSTDDSLLKFVYLAGFISFFIDFIGALFKLMHWPGAGWFLVIGIPLPFVLFLPAYIVYHTKRKLKTDIYFFGVISFMIYLGVFSSLLAIGPQKGFINSIAFSTNSISDSNAYLMGAYETNQSSEVNKKTQQLIKHIEKLKISLVAESSEEAQGAILTNPITDFTKIQRPYVYTSFGSPGNNQYSELNTLLEDYCNTLPKNREYKTQRLIDEINAYRIPLAKGKHPIFFHMRLIEILNILTDWQNKILLIDYILT